MAEYKIIIIKKYRLAERRGPAVGPVMAGHPAMHRANAARNGTRTWRARRSPAAAKARAVQAAPSRATDGTQAVGGCAFFDSNQAACAPRTASLTQALRVLGRDPRRLPRRPRLLWRTSRRKSSPLASMTCSRPTPRVLWRSGRRFWRAC